MDADCQKGSLLSQPVRPVRAGAGRCAGGVVEKFAEIVVGMLFCGEMRLRVFAARWIAVIVGAVLRVREEQRESGTSPARPARGPTQSGMGNCRPGALEGDRCGPSPVVCWLESTVRGPLTVPS